MIAGSLLFFSACHSSDKEQTDKLNDKAYAFHYRNLDSVSVYAEQAFTLADGGDGAAEAINNKAFVALMHMEYDVADSLLKQVAHHTDNQIELLIADVQQMRRCQRCSHNKEFYEHREKAQARLRRIDEERAQLSDRWQRRLLYAETEFAIVNSTYYYYVGLKEQSQQALQAISPHGVIQSDTAQYLNYLYNIGVGGMITGHSAEEVMAEEMRCLERCLTISRQGGYIYFEANALEAIAEHLSIPDSLPIFLFRNYGDRYQLAGAWRTLATCQMRNGHFEEALSSLDSALSRPIISQAPDLVAGIHEQLCVAWSALDNKRESDVNRNYYLDLQELTRQDRYLEARASSLEAASNQLNLFLIVVTLSVVFLLILLFVFHLLRRRKRKYFSYQSLMLPLERWREENEQRFREAQENAEELKERLNIAKVNVEDEEYRQLEHRARLSKAMAVIPLIDRMLNEVDHLTHRHEDEKTQQARRDYISDLARQINSDNEVLTHWIQLRKGELTLHVESFPLQPLFELVERNRMSFTLKNITFDVVPTQAIVKADPMLTIFMINTLADNARKFTPEGGKVTILAQTTESYVEVSVQDTGVGFDQQKDDAKITAMKGCGFGLMNCRGIIEKYLKTSRLFRVCMLGIESEKGQGSRVFFRLPLGIVRLLLLAFTLMTSVSGRAAATVEQSMTRDASFLSTAKSFADSAYFSNIHGDYHQTLVFADSCHHYLNAYYLTQNPHGHYLMKLLDGNAHTAAELTWLRDSLPTDYHTILDIRNEAAVAALALHQWQLYQYNNQIYISLYKEMSSDNTLADYCRKMQEVKSNKTVAVMFLLLLLLSILPAYYFIYGKHHQNYKFCLERVKTIHKVLASKQSTEEKLHMVKDLTTVRFPDELRTVVDIIVKALEEELAHDRQQQLSREQIEEELHKVEQEEHNLHVINAVMDNSMSSLKHETMYYPGRILQLLNGNAEELRQTIAYYRDLYGLFIRQCMKQQERHYLPVSKVRGDEISELLPHHVIFKGNLLLLQFLMRSLIRQASSDLKVTVTSEQKDYIKIVFSATAFDHFDMQMFGQPQQPHFIYMMCRQIVRDHSEMTHLRGCGIRAVSEDGRQQIVVNLPGELTD